MNKPSHWCGLILAALSLSLPAFAGTAADEVHVNNPYVRAVPAMMKNSAAFMSLHNTGGVDHAIVAASTASAEVVELHTHTKDGNVMRMRRVDAITLKAGDTTVLQPGGLHIMLLGLTGALSPETSIDLELTFADGSRKAIVAPVRKVDGMHQGQGHHMH